MHLECRQLVYRYPSAAAELFDNLSLSIDGAGFHALFGPSGVGKTTLARILTGAAQASSGRIDKHGIRQVLYTYNLERLPAWASVRDHIDEVSADDRSALKEELIAACGLQDVVAARFNRLSLGQQNRANLVRYLLQDFDLLIMDESLANVDELTRERIILTIKALFPQRGFLYISHNVAEVAKFCRQVRVLRAASKTPQVVSVQGCDYTGAAPAETGRLERAMLEIVHAA
jgi:ABC-type nitrate/sulfonate/bicarbonate transport system ATPase subunit